MNDSALRYDWFSPEDFEVVAKLIERYPNTSSPPIIVGGQSLVGWAYILDVPVPATNTPYLTSDLDLLCPRDVAQWLADQLKVPLHSAGLTDNTCQSGKLVYQPSEDRGLLIIDFLSSILGPANEEVKRLAVPVSYNGIKLHLLQPILCLHSRLANLFTLRAKRDGNGIAQAVVAVAVAAEYLRRLAENDPPRAMRYVREVIRIASTKEGVFCYAEWSIDPLKAVFAETVSSRLRYLSKYRYQEPLRRLFRHREVASSVRLGSVHHRREIRQQQHYIDTQLTDVLQGWGCKSVWIKRA